MDILEEIVAHKRMEIAERKAYIAPHDLYRRVEQMLAASGEQPAGGSMRQALMQSDTGIIAEFKRKSPSKGWIHQDARVDQVAPAYQQAGASAMSILTDTRYFGGYDEFIQHARAAGVTLPVLYKNFVVDEYQLFQAGFCGASAVLLIAACLQKDECRQLMSLAHELGLEVLLEMHDERETDYADLEPDMCGINNRHLGTFVTSVDTSFALAQRLPCDACCVSESGLGDAATVRQLRQAGFRGFLMGEHFMREADPGLALSNFINALKQ